MFRKSIRSMKSREKKKKKGKSKTESSRRQTSSPDMTQKELTELIEHAKYAMDPSRRKKLRDVKEKYKKLARKEYTADQIKKLEEEALSDRIVHRDFGDLALPEEERGERYTQDELVMLKKKRSESRSRPERGRSVGRPPVSSRPSTKAHRGEGWGLHNDGWATHLEGVEGANMKKRKHKKKKSKYKKKINKRKKTRRKKRSHKKHSKNSKHR